jgi:hypothetical protein
MNNTTQQLIALKLKIISQLADSLVLGCSPTVIRKGLRLIADTTFDAAYELSQLRKGSVSWLRRLIRVFDRSRLSAAEKTWALVALFLASGKLAHRAACSSFGSEAIGAPVKRQPGPGLGAVHLYDAV